MSDFNNPQVVNDGLLAWKAKQTKQVDSQQVPQVPVDGQTVVQDPPEAESKPVAQDPPTEQEPPKTDAAPATPEVKTEEVVDEQPKSWDADDKVVTDTTPTPSTVDFSKLGGALGWNVKDESEFVAQATQLKTKVKELEEKPLAGVPDDFKEVIEIAKKQGDWKQYLSEQLVDFRKIDPVQLFYDEAFRNAQNDPRYRGADGKFDEKLFEDAFDTIPYEIQRTSGIQLQQHYVREQQNRQTQIRAKAEAKVAQAESALSNATQKLSETLPFENYGIKWEAKHSVGIYSGIVDSTLTKKHLGVTYDKLVESGADMGVVSRTIALAEHGEKMIKFKSQNAETKAKKAILEKTQNVQLDNPGGRIAPQDETKKVLSVAEKLQAYMETKNKSIFDKN